MRLHHQAPHTEQSLHIVRLDSKHDSVCGIHASALCQNKVDSDYLYEAMARIEVRAYGPSWHDGSPKADSGWADRYWARLGRAAVSCESGWIDFTASPNCLPMERSTPTIRGLTSVP